MKSHSILFGTAFGDCRIAWNDAGLTEFKLPVNAGSASVQRQALEASQEPAIAAPPEWIQGVIGRVREHFGGGLQDFSDVVLDWSRVSPFQKAVYLNTQGVKAGCRTSYGEIAGLMGLGSQAARAVGVALATNPWPLIVPCHRVVSAGGKMTGFSSAGGVRTKTRLLALEGAELLSE